MPGQRVSRESARERPAKAFAPLSGEPFQRVAELTVRRPKSPDDELRAQPLRIASDPQLQQLAFPAEDSPLAPALHLQEPTSLELQGHATDGSQGHCGLLSQLSIGWDVRAWLGEQREKNSEAVRCGEEAGGGFSDTCRLHALDVNVELPRPTKKHVAGGVDEVDLCLLK